MRILLIDLLTGTSALLFTAFFCLAQQAPPRPVGRSYSTGDEPRRTISPAPRAPSPVTFSDVTARSGISFVNFPSPTAQKYLLETMGGGVAMLDYDADDRLDLFFANGARLADPMLKNAAPDKSEPRFWNRLYRQQPDGTFEDVTERAGVRGAGYSMGVAAADYDGDGRVDLYVTAFGGNTLYRNNGDGTFADVTEKLNVRGDGWSTSAGWMDFDRDNRLDLFVARYMEWDFERGALYCGEQREGMRAYCHPNNFRGAGNLLFHQLPDGRFEDVSVRAGVADAEGKGLGVAFADFDNDGWPDIFVAHDSVRQSLYRNRGNGTFEDVALIGGAGYDENGKTFAGMGVDAADYNNDGHTDVFVTTLSNEMYALFKNNGDLSFTPVTNTTGVGQITLLYSGWGTRFVDADNDGWRDLFVAQSHVLDTIEKSSSYLKYKQTPLLMRNLGKNFVDVSASAGAAFATPIAARGAAFGDLNNDGQTDVVINVLGGKPLVLRNNGTKNNWVRIALRAAARSNINALGARLTVTDSGKRTQIFDVTTAGSYLSSNDPRVNVGLGAAGKIERLEVRWPQGTREQFQIAGVNQTFTLVEGAGTKMK